MKFGEKVESERKGRKHASNGKKDSTPPVSQPSITRCEAI